MDIIIPKKIKVSKVSKAYPNLLISVISAELEMGH